MSRNRPSLGTPLPSTWHSTQTQLPSIGFPFCNSIAPIIRGSPTWQAARLLMAAGQTRVVVVAEADLGPMAIGIRGGEYLHRPPTAAGGS